MYTLMRCRYEEVVDFQDPITKYTSLAGYLYNIKMLKQVRMLACHALRHMPNIGNNLLGSSLSGYL